MACTGVSDNFYSVENSRMAFEILCSLLVHRKAFRACHKSWRRRAREVCAGGGPVGREGAGLNAAPGERGGGEEPPLAGQLDQWEGEGHTYEYILYIYVNICKHLSDLAVTVGSVWSYFRLTLASFGDFAIILESFWGQFGVPLDHFG